MGATKECVECGNSRTIFIMNLKMDNGFVVGYWNTMEKTMAEKLFEFQLYR